MQPMNLYFLGLNVPGVAIGPLLENIHWAPLTEEVPPFMVDAIVQIGKITETDYLRTLRRFGRPILVLPVDISQQELRENLRSFQLRQPALPRSNYQPINCSFYDHFEIAILQRMPVDLSFVSADGTTVQRQTRLLDTKTDRTEEFVQLENGHWLRLDQIKTINGQPAGESCRF